MTDSPASGSETTPRAYAKGSPEYRRMHTELGFLAIAVIINVIGFSIVFPLVPYLVQHGLGPHVQPDDPEIGRVSGWLTAVYALMQFIFAPFWGRLSDRVGRKPILIMSLIGDAIFYTMFGLSHSLTGLFTARILAGIFSSATLAVAQAYAADVTPPDHRAAGLGMIGASFGVGFVFGPALGGALGGNYLGLPLFVSAGLALINMVFIAKYLPEPTRPPGAEVTSGPPAAVHSRLGLMTKVLTGPVGFLYALTFLVTLGFAFLEGTFTTYLMQHFGYKSQRSTTVQGLVFTYIGFILVMVQGGAIRPLVKRFGEAPLVPVGVGLMALGFALFPLCKSLTALLLGPMIPIAVGSGLNTPALRALISKSTAATAQGTTLGLSASFDSLARAVGPASAGWLYGTYGQASPYWCAAVLMAFAFAFSLTQLRSMRRYSETQSTG